MMNGIKIAHEEIREMVSQSQERARLGWVIIDQ